MEKITGFSVRCRRSSIQAAGTGVFVSGQIKAGSLVALYPGIIRINWLFVYRLWVNDYIMIHTAFLF